MIDYNMSNTDEICQASVIIPSYGQREHISKVLDSLQNQVTKYNYEIIVIESSGDGTADLVRQKYPEVRIIELRTRAFPGDIRDATLHVIPPNPAILGTGCHIDVQGWIGDQPGHASPRPLVGGRRVERNVLIKKIKK